MDNTIKSLTALGLCYGRGGLDRGLERGIAALRNTSWQEGAIVKHAAYVEIESFAAYNLVAQMEKGVLAPAPVWSDLKTFPWEQFYRKVHIITGGYPCQPFSQAGLQNGVEDPRHLFPFIEHGIDSVRPVLCFFENVANHLNIGYQEVRQRISSLGYKVEADIFAANHVGAPHLRKRLFILAVADTYCSEQSKRRGDLAEMLGLQEGQRQPEHRAAVSAGDGQPVGNSDDQWKQQPAGTERESRRWAGDAGERKLDNTAGRSHEQEDEVRAGRDRPASSSPTVDHSFQSRLEGHPGNGSARARWENTVRSIASTSIWPAPQGPDQYEWEYHRLESSLGFTAHGYDFTTDLLRMEGNAVVEQQAELAFRTLIQKFA